MYGAEECSVQEIFYICTAMLTYWHVYIKAFNVFFVLVSLIAFHLQLQKTIN